MMLYWNYHANVKLTKKTTWNFGLNDAVTS